MHSFKERLFLTLSAVAPNLPSFRGKARIFLALFNVLGLKTHHVTVKTRLQRPVAFNAVLDLHSWLQRLAYITGSYEAETVQFLYKVFKKLDTSGYVLDIGANIGMIAIPLTMMLEKEHGMGGQTTIAVEAVVDNFNALCTNVRLNDLGSAVTCINAALGDTNKSVDIQVEGDLRDGEGSGTANILADGCTYDCVRIPIELTTLDSLMQGVATKKRCTLIKIDTDGYDLKILFGGKEFLKQHRPVIFGEFSAHCLSWHGQTIHDVCALAQTLDYAVWQKKPGKFEFMKGIDLACFKRDLLLVPQEDTDKFSWCSRPI
jgi:FkbM family methyltransferase